MTTVYQAVGAIISGLKGVGKEQRNKEQGYNFRGIDDVLKALHPLLAEHGVFICPDVLEREYEERLSKSGTVGHCAHLHVRFRVYGPEGDSVELSTWGEGLDYGDKATNKAMTAAFKYALFELFAVADPADDSDHESPQESATVPKTNRRSQGTVRRPPNVDPETGEIDSRSPSTAAPASIGADTSPAGSIDSMKPREVRDALIAAGLEASGSVEEMRKRLAEHQSGAPPVHVCADCAEPATLYKNEEWWCQSHQPF